MTDAPAIASTIPPSIDRPVWTWLILAGVLLGSFSLRLNHLDHPYLHALDEAFHAVVARNLIDDPLRPVLYAEAQLPFDYRDWKANHVWLHKPILPLWQMAGSMAVFGVEAWALRLPSAVLMTAAAWLTYLTGARLFGRAAGLIAAALHAFNPATYTLVHGYIFSDHVDVALLFWVQVGVYFVVHTAQTGRTGTAALAGAGQGLAFLSKTYPGLIVLGVALTAWALTRLGWPAGRAGARIRWSRRQMLAFAVAAVAVVTPWTVWCLVHFPRELVYEHLHALQHLTHDVEQFAGPWDRVLADYSLRLFHVFYPFVLVATVLLGIDAVRRRDASVLLLLAWGLGVLVPFVLATSKTPSATLIGLPAGWIAVGVLVGRAFCGNWAAIGALVTVSLLGVAFPGSFPQQGWGFPPDRAFAGVLREYPWPFLHAGGGLIGAAAFAGLGHWADARLRGWRHFGPAMTVGILVLLLGILATGSAGWLAWRYARTAYRITEVNRTEPSFRAVGRIADADLPPNAVLLLEETAKFQHIALMFWSGRDAYATDALALPAQVRALRQRGAEPFLVARVDRLSRPRIVAPGEGWGVFELPDDPTGLLSPP